MRSPRSGPSQLGSERTTDTIAPRTPAEEVVASVLASYLGVGGLGVHDNFFELGGNSLMAHQVVQQLRSIFRIDLPLLSVFERPTVDSLVSAMAHMWGGREIVEEIAWTFAEVQRLTEFDAKKMLAELSVESVVLD
jgi:hypothetical protein